MYWRPSVSILFLTRLLAMRLAVLHNLWFYNELARRIREALDAGAFAAFRAEYTQRLAERL